MRNQPFRYTNAIPLGGEYLVESLNPSDLPTGLTEEEMKSFAEAFFSTYNDTTASGLKEVQESLPD